VRPQVASQSTRGEAKGGKRGGNTPGVHKEKKKHTVLCRPQCGRATAFKEDGFLGERGGKARWSRKKEKKKGERTAVRKIIPPNGRKESWG